jgi:hypothetical protein
MPKACTNSLIGSGSLSGRPQNISALARHPATSVALAIRQSAHLRELPIAGASEGYEHLSSR